MATTVPPIARFSGKLAWDDDERASLAVVATVLLGCSLWDFYIQGVGLRPFDVLTVIALIAAAISGVGGPFRLDAPGARRVVLAWLAVALYTVIGTIADVDNARPALGFLMGLIMFALTTMLPVATRRVLVAATTACILIHCAAFWLQLVVYYGSGLLINYHAWLGGEPRVFSGILFRACGLNLEPADFAINAFLLVTLRMRFTRRLDGVAVLALISSCASLSLWGVVSSLLLFATKAWRTRSFWIVVLLAIVAAVSVLPSLDDLSRSVFLVNRVTSLNSDSSSSIRYGVLLPSLVDLIWDPATWFGAGITDNYHLFGASGLGFLIRALGLVGVAGFLLGVFVASPAGEKSFTTLATAVALTATTFWTNMLWWFWLALMLRTFRVADPPSVARDAASEFERPPGALC